MLLNLHNLNLLTVHVMVVYECNVFDMTTLNDLDPFYIKSIASLYSREHFRTGDISPLQKLVEDAIKAKSGIEKDFTAIVTACVKQQTMEDFKSIGGTIEETKTASSSDNELELDLLKEDLMCVVCNGMDVGARNQLLECFDCHSLYHQECHRPPVSQQDAVNTWICQSCKDIKKIRKSPNTVRSSSPHGKPTLKTSTSSSHRGSSSSSLYKSSSSSSKPASSKLSSSSSSKSSVKSSSSVPTSVSNSSSSRNVVTPNINIISADKRIQSMKKKAAKMQEKRKLPR